jgi:hypothetical protein
MMYSLLQSTVFCHALPLLHSTPTQTGSCPLLCGLWHGIQFRFSARLPTNKHYTQSDLVNRVATVPYQSFIHHKQPVFIVHPQWISCAAFWCSPVLNISHLVKSSMRSSKFLFTFHYEITPIQHYKTDNSSSSYSTSTFWSCMGIWRLPLTHSNPMAHKLRLYINHWHET